MIVLMAALQNQRNHWNDVPSTPWTSTAPHQQLRQADIQELQQKATSGNPRTAVVGEHPIQRH